MVAPLPRSADMLGLLHQLTRTLHEQQPFALRVQMVFEILHQHLPYQDGRLTCWFQSAQPGSRRQHYLSHTPAAAPWDDRLMRQVAVQGRFTYDEREAPAEANDSDHADSTALARRTGLPYCGVPIIWDERLWGVLELRADRTMRFEPALQQVLSVLATQLATAIAHEGEQQYAAALLPAPAMLSAETAAPAVNLPQAWTNQLDEPLRLPELLQLLLEWGLQATAAEAGAICLVDHERAELVLAVHQGYPAETFATDPETRQPVRWSWQTGLAGRAVQSGRALLVRDVTTETGQTPLSHHLRPSWLHRSSTMIGHWQ
ncbi:MAG: GAF domain-containing protein [Chloroflexaceae bacterium]|nr:GAF domain-containing protein [Chloroflexaceae bacterium]